jgi:hypothetical protein
MPLDEYFFYAIVKYGYLQSEPEKPLKIFIVNDLGQEFWMTPLDASLLENQCPQFMTTGILGKFLCKKQKGIQWIELEDHLVVNSKDDIYKILLDRMNPFAKDYQRLITAVDPGTVLSNYL